MRADPRALARPGPRTARRPGRLCTALPRGARGLRGLLALLAGSLGALFATALLLAPRAAAQDGEEDPADPGEDPTDPGDVAPDQDQDGQDQGDQDGDGQDQDGQDGDPAQESEDPCELLAGPARSYCEEQDAGGSGGPDTSRLDSTLDPLSSLAQGCADAAAWVVDQLSDAVNTTTNVDFTNPAFLRQYAVVFAAATVLTLTLWLLAVVKRAVRGVPLTTAISEAVGYLWLTVMASAFTPLILYVVVAATDGVTDVVAAGTGDDSDAFFGQFSAALEAGDEIGGGPIMLIVVSLISILAAGVLWLELVLRAALLYVGALLGTAVYAGLVDKNLWGHVRRWAGIMIAVILVKPVIVIVLGLASALTTSDGPTAFSAIVSGLAIILLAIFASAMIYRFVPGFGDDIVSHRAMRQDTSSRAASAAIATPATVLRQGMGTHGARGGDGAGGGGGAQSGPSGGGQQQSAGSGLAGGVAAHGSRPAGSGQGSGGRSGAGGKGGNA